MSNPTFTPEYIAMAKAAEEIQAMRAVPTSFQNGDAVIGNLDQVPKWVGELNRIDDHDNGLFEMYSGEYNTESEVVAHVWLPRLDQLLGMLGSPNDLLEAAAYAGPEKPIRFADGLPADWHELALSVVMGMKFGGKVWTGTEWRKA